jgi:hypothetical protein
MRRAIVIGGSRGGLFAGDTLLRSGWDALQETGAVPSVEAKYSALTKTELLNHLLCLMKFLSAGDPMRTRGVKRGERRFAQPEARVERACYFFY